MSYGPVDIGCCPRAGRWCSPAALHPAAVRLRPGRPAAGSKLELREKARPDRLERPQCEQACAAKELGPLVLPVPTRRELVAALVSVL
nr:hypothetical protein KitaXyl93_76220 [Kitasatospora sp. Xyl93]